MTRHIIDQRIPFSGFSYRIDWVKCSDVQFSQQIWCLVFYTLVCITSKTIQFMNGVIGLANNLNEIRGDVNSLKIVTAGFEKKQKQVASLQAVYQIKWK